MRRLYSTSSINQIAKKKKKFVSLKTNYFYELFFSGMCIKKKLKKLKKFLFFE